MNVAIVGAGIAGLTCADRLHPEDDVVLFEATSHVGGHARTIVVDDGAREWPIDVGVYSYYPPAYPRLERLLERFDVPTRDVDWTFALREDDGRLVRGEATRRRAYFDARTLMRPANLPWLRQIHRFHRLGNRYLDVGRDDGDFGTFLDEGRFAPRFVRATVGAFGRYTWLAGLNQLRRYSASYVLGALRQWGFLSMQRQPWRGFPEGTRSYVDRLAAPFRDAIRLATPVRSVTRVPDGGGGGVIVETEAGERQTFDAAVLAVNADCGLRLLADSTPDERRILGAFDYLSSEVVVHTDSTVVDGGDPTATFNLSALADDDALRFHYNLVRALGRDDPFDVFASVDPGRTIPDEQILLRERHQHPMFTPRATAAQRELGRINGPLVHFCGAHWGEGFHEAAIASGERAAESVRGGRP